MVRLNKILFETDSSGFSDTSICIMNGYELEQLILIYKKDKNISSITKDSVFHIEPVVSSFVVNGLSVGLNICNYDVSIPHDMNFLFHVFLSSMNDDFFK
jgi:hypothetical protein